MIFVKAKIADMASAVIGRLFASTGLHILMYHSVSNSIGKKDNNIYCISTELFSQHVKFISQNFNDNIVSIKSGIRRGSGLAFSFDDGYRDNLTIAAPLLVEANIPFTVFVTMEYIRSGSTEFLSELDLRELAKLPGVSIGTHGRRHLPLTKCSMNELNDELQTPKKWLENILGKEVSMMSYPYGLVDERVRRAVAKAGYHLATCSKFGAYNKNSNLLSLPRIEVWSEDKILRLKSKATGHWDWIGLIK